MNDQPRHTIYDFEHPEELQPLDEHSNAIKGIVSGVCLSIPIWILIGLVWAVI
jgi:hypothetical protein